MIMLRTLVVAFLALQLEDVTASSRRSGEVTSVLNDADTLTENPYVRVRWTPGRELDPYGNRMYQGVAPVYVDFLQDITADLGLKLSLWFERHRLYDGLLILEDLQYQDFCSALENQTLLTKPYYPDPIKMLALEDRHCPIEKGAVELPWHRGIQALEDYDTFEDCLSWTNLGIRIEGPDSTVEDSDPYVVIDSSEAALCS